jgi:CsoR family transcriptional regulator, copper-sensing transcriptional repressor
MLNETQKRKVMDRLRRIEGQVRGVQKMVEEDRYCMDVLAQTRAIVAALQKTEDLVMQQHLQTCVVDAFRSNDPEQRNEKIEEVMSVLSKFRKHG